MAMLRANKLLPIILGLLVLIVVVVMIRAKGGGAHTNAQMATLPQTAAPDADSPAETVKSVAATVQDIQKQNAILVQQNRELLAQKAQILHEVRGDVEVAHKKDQEENASFINGLKNKIDDLSGRVNTAIATSKPANSTTYAVNGGSGDIPAGLGYDDDSFTLGNKLVWIEPLGTASAGDDGSGMLKKVSTTTAAGARGAGRLLQSGASGLGTLGGEVKDRINAVGSGDSGVAGGPGGKLQPRFTVNRNATLMGATAWTAIIGRIPVKGTVSDPMPFKVLVGAKNLAANGLELPSELEGMVFSGRAVGDFTLRCSTGRLDSVTFVFTDGTIRTESADANGGGDGLGYISDRQGIPCVSGELITNAPTYLTERVGVMALETAGDAYAAKQLTTTQNPLGGTTSAVTGEIGKFVWGKSVAGGASEIRKWLDERQQQSFDAVFVRPGVELALHINKELHIDYDPSGRKLRHDDSASKNGQTANVD
jgi:integrating conjugative element protein (TIGR03752 family)